MHCRRSSQRPKLTWKFSLNFKYVFFVPAGTFKFSGYLLKRLHFQKAYIPIRPGPTRWLNLTGVSDLPTKLSEIECCCGIVQGERSLYVFFSVDTYLLKYIYFLDWFIGLSLDKYLCPPHLKTPSAATSPPRHSRKRNVAAKLRVVSAFFAGTFYLVYKALLNDAWRGRVVQGPVVAKYSQMRNIWNTTSSFE